MYRATFVGTAGHSKTYRQEMLEGTRGVMEGEGKK